MRFSTKREQLLEPITVVEKSTSKNLNLPVLSCILLEVSNDTLSLSATNLDVGVRYDLPVQDAQNGRAAVSGTVLAQVISSLGSGASVTIATNETHLLVRSKGATSHIALQDASEFPVLPHVGEGTELTLPSKALHEALQSVSYCASTSTIKPELSSVFVHVDGGTLITAATDSFRLAEKRVPLKKAVSCDPFLVPARSIVELLRILEQEKDTITICVSEHQLSLTLPAVYLTMRLTSGTFPDYTQIIPKEFVTEATMLVHDIERTLRKAAVFSDQFNQTTLSIAPKKKEFTVHTENTTVGETTDTVAAALSGQALTIRFNQRYLLDALHSIGTDSISIHFASQSQAAIVRPVGNDSFIYLVMPMNR